MHPEDDRSDLATQFESLLHVVWECEREWRLDDRIALSLSRERAVSASRERGPEGR